MIYAVIAFGMFIVNIPGAYKILFGTKGFDGVALCCHARGEETRNHRQKDADRNQDDSVKRFKEGGKGGNTRKRLNDEVDRDAKQ